MIGSLASEFRLMRDCRRELMDDGEGEGREREGRREEEGKQESNGRESREKGLKEGQA